VNPFLPWPGSKAKCSRPIIEEFPEAFNTYFEPFLGSGAIFFAMNDVPANKSRRSFKRARLSDTNKRLINCFRSVMERPEHVKTMLVHCLERNSEEFYLAMRSQMDNPSVFLYVMRAAFSSMYRENLKGEFNVPWRKQDFELHGRRISYDVEQLDACSRYMIEKNVELSVASWIDAIQDVKAGDAVYFDPPYLPYTETGFVNYVAGGFGEGEHVFLRTQARLLSEKGAFVALSNSDVPASRRIYGEPHKIISVANSVKANATDKGKRQEGLWIWRPV
jgi:DNA adenine methylase